LLKLAPMKKRPILPPNIQRSTAIAAIALLIATLNGCTQQAENPILKLDECILAGGMEVRCGTIKVPENPAEPNGKLLELDFVVRPAKVRNKLPDPVFFFAGGPGQAATETAEMLTAVFDKVNNNRDLVFLDQRGTGEKSLLQCEDDEVMSDPLLALVTDDFKPEKMAECVKALKTNPRFYGTTTAMGDAEALRVKLGYDKMNLWGASYGTRAALEYARRYESKVRSVILDGMAPADMRLSVSMTRDAQAIFDRVLTDCAAKPECNAAYPNLGVGTQQMLAQLDLGPAQSMVTHPITGERKTYNITSNSIRAALFRPLYIPQLQAVLPGALHSAISGDYAPLMSLNLMMLQGGLSDVSFGMHSSIVCGEDIKPLTVEDRAKAGAMFKPAFTAMYDRTCAVWPAADVPADFATPVKNALPTLILSGGRDPVTPPIYGEQVAKGLSASKHLIAPNIGHGVSMQGCAPKLLAEFINKASVEKIDGECLKRLPAPQAVLPMQISALPLESVPMPIPTPTPAPTTKVSP
jgi:pimeloyl-ACP methyl ester carboxylesterase